MRSCEGPDLFSWETGGPQDGTSGDVRSTSHGSAGPPFGCHFLELALMSRYVLIVNDYFRRKEAVGARDGKMAEKLVKAAETWQKSHVIHKWQPPKYRGRIQLALT